MRKKLLYLLFLFGFLFSFLLPVQAANQNVIDRAGVLAQEELAELESLAQQYSLQHNIGYYIRLVPNHNAYPRIEDYAEYLYKKENLGLGENKEGLLLVVSIEDRSFDLVAYGSKANEIYHAEKRTEIAKTVVNDYLSMNQFFDGFKAYLEEANSAIQVPLFIRMGITGFLPFFLSGFYVFFQKRKNHSADILLEAHDYVEAGLQLTLQQDQFLYSTTQVIHRPRNNSSSGGFHSSSSGGFGHTSGHF